MAALVKVSAGGSANRFFGRLLERGRESFLGPIFFGRRGMTAFEDVGNRTFGYGPVQVGFRFVLGHSVPHSGFDDRGGWPCCKTARPTERLVKLKFTVCTSVSSFVKISSAAIP